MKKAMKAALCILSAITMATGSALSASAGTLSREELIEKYMPDGAYDILQRKYDEHWRSGTGISYFDADDTEIDVIAYVQGLMDDLQAKRGEMTEEEYRKAQEELAQKTVAICQNADHRAYLFNDYRSGWNHQQWFKNCEYENGFWYVLREDGTASIVGAEQEYFKDKDVLAIPSEIGGAVVKEIEHHAFDSASLYLQDITEIVIPDTVEIIGESAFNDALLYTSGKMNMPAHVKYIGRFGFAGCAAWLADESKVIHIPESVEYMGFGAFGHWADIYYNALLAMPESLVLMEEYCFEDPVNEKYVFLNGDANYLYMKDVAAYYAKSEARPAAIASFAGDANADGTVDVADIDLSDVAEYYTKVEPKPAALPTLAGDVDGSGKVDVSDSVLLARYCAEDSAVTLTADGKANADVNADGSINTADVTAIQKIIAKL